MRGEAARQKNGSIASNTTAATAGHEAQLRQMADALRGSMDAAEYKHVVLGLIFLKFISDSFPMPLKNSTRSSPPKRPRAAA